jgi:hypothetical protein
MIITVGELANGCPTPHYQNDMIHCRKGSPESGYSFKFLLIQAYIKILFLFQVSVHRRILAERRL